MEDLKSAATDTITNDDVPIKGSDRSHDIINMIKTPPNNGKLYNESNEKLTTRVKVMDNML